MAPSDAPTDFLIIGGGTAGAALAERLSADAATQVVLIEAGPDTPPGAVPADIADTFPSSSLNTDYFWPGLGASRFEGEAARPFTQARIMGGGSTVMGMWALRGLPSDYDGWAAAGARGWAWDDVLPRFRRIEDDADRSPPRNTPGPLPIRRVLDTAWPDFARAMGRIAAARGLPRVGDMNEAPGVGFFPMPLFQDGGGRVSSARSHLTEAVRRRGNLTILARTRVVRLVVAGGRIDGVIVDGPDGRRTLAAREVALSAGAIHSPTLLLRSGIGPAPLLRDAGIAPVVDLPGVGANLQNHLYLHFGLTLPAGHRIAPELRQFAFAGLRLSSGAAECPPADLLLFAIGRVSPRAFGVDAGLMGAALYAPFSRGAVTLAGPDPATAPRIDFRMLSDPRDGPRLVTAARAAEAMLRDPEMTPHYTDAYLMPPVMAANQFSRPGLAGDLLAMAAKLALNVPSAVSRAMVEPMIRPGRWCANRLGHATLTDAELLAAAAPMAHPCGTCAMGAADDPAAVVDPRCRVRGIANLRVVDASIMPRIPAANTNLPTLMIAHRVADLIADQGRG